jgi:hypothetical protein
MDENTTREKSGELENEKVGWRNATLSGRELKMN